MALPYLATVGTDLWLGAVTTLIGAALGGSISFIVSRQQIKSAWIQRAADAAEERNRRSEDRRFTAYSEFITRARSSRNALRAYYQHSGSRPSIKELDTVLQSAQDSSTLVFCWWRARRRTKDVSLWCAPLGLRKTCSTAPDQAGRIIRGLNLIGYLGDPRATSKTPYALSSE